jgi:hypothetical protein
VDHLVSMEIGGNNAINLWPEPLLDAYGARAKDKVENQLHSLVCSGYYTLRDAQHFEAVNWSTAVAKLEAKPVGPSFRDGTHVVGTNLSARTWTAPGGVVCNWELDKDGSGSTAAMIDFAFGAVGPIVSVNADAPVLTVHDCGVWHRFAAPGHPVTTFKDGSYLVNAAIAPGTYRSAGGSKCYWELDNSLSGDLSSIVSNSFGATNSAVTIAATDTAFKAEHCAKWILVPPPPYAGPVSTFSDGTWTVGVDILPGTYQASGGDGCYWERESAGGALIANGYTDPAPAVTIQPTDVTFLTFSCGTWNLVP